MTFSMLKLLLVCLALVALITPSVANEIPIGKQGECFPRVDGLNPEFVEYLKQMRERFYRNLSKLDDAHDVTIRFFLTAKGLVKDVSIVESSGTLSQDLACIDAVCCASPLPSPPVIKTFLRPPPEAFLYTPNEYGEGVYTFTFSKNLSGSETERQCKNSPIALSQTNLQISIIPKEVLYRYPGLFSAEELASPSNQLTVDVDPNLLESIRIPWSLRYSISDSPSKQELINLSRSITAKYFDQRKGLRSDN